LIFFKTIESEKSIAMSSRMVYPCDTIRIVTKNETKRTRHHRETKGSLLVNPTFNKQV